MPALAPLPDAPLDRPLRLAVLTCEAPGWDTAAALAAAPGVEVVAVVRTPLPRAKSARTRLKNVYKYHGAAGLLRIPLNRAAALVRALRARREGDGGVPPVPGVQALWFRDFHAPDALAALAALDLDLAVVDGTGILRESVFGLPRYGMVNLHCGRLPDYRGAPPAFWELLAGEREVGVTVHRVTAKLDEGPILAQELFPLDPAPPGDPVRYVRDLWRDVLRPNGLRLLARVAAEVAAGRVEPRPQGPTDKPTFRRPDRHAVADFRRRVAARRAGR